MPSATRSRTRTGGVAAPGPCTTRTTAGSRKGVYTADLAASYAYGLAKNHGFVDGNKRTAWVVARVFLAENGHGLTFDVDEAVQVMEPVSASETELAHWLRERLVADQGPE